MQLSFVRRFVHDESGATVVEYGLLIALLSLVAIVSIVGAARYVNGAFDLAQTEMANSGIPSK